MDLPYSSPQVPFATLAPPAVMQSLPPSGTYMLMFNVYCLMFTQVSDLSFSKCSLRGRIFKHKYLNTKLQ